MVIYQIQIPESQKDAFLNIIKSLQSVGMVKSFKPAHNLAISGEPVSAEKLAVILENSEQQVKEGFTFTTDEAATFLAAWKSRKR
jgi:hypothetical protein